MASAQPKLRESLASIRMQPLHLPVISNVTAQPHGAPVQIADLLVQQVTAPVRWEASMRYLLAQGFTRFIELGPGAALSGFMRRIDSSVQIFNVADLATFRETSRQLRTEKVDQ